MSPWLCWKRQFEMARLDVASNAERGVLVRVVARQREAVRERAGELQRVRRSRRPCGVGQERGVDELSCDRAAYVGRPSSGLVPVCTSLRFW